MFLDRLDDEARFRRLDKAGFDLLQIWDIDVWNNPDEVVEALINFSTGLV